MDIVLYSNRIDEYLKHDNVVDFIKIAYEFVRDNISHSADIKEDIITCTASEVLKAGHGNCLLNLTCWQLYYAANLFRQAFVIKS